MATTPIWQSQGDEKRERVRSMFAAIAPSYDRVNRLMSMNLDMRWRQTVVQMLGLKPGDAVLDLCCGTGDFLKPLRAAIGSGGKLTGVDFCEPMLVRAREKDSAASLALGDACRLPVASHSAEAVTVGWGIRNVPDIDLAHREIFRALKPGGRFASIDMARPQSGLIRAVSNVLTRKGLPILGGLFGAREAYAYLPESTQLFWDREKLADSMRQAGFEDVKWRDLYFGNICIHYGRKP